MALEDDPKTTTTQSGSRDTSASASQPEDLDRGLASYVDIEANLPPHHDVVAERLHEKSFLRSKAPGDGTGKDFEGNSYAYVWAPIGLSLGAFALGLAGRRYGILFRGQTTLAARVKLAGSCATGGTMLFWGMGTAEHWRRVHSLNEPPLPIAVLRMAMDRREQFKEWERTTYPTLNTDAYFERAYGPYIPSDAGVWRALLERLRHWTHHMWSTKAAQAYCRIDGSLQVALEELGYSPHDIDIIVTSASRGLVMDELDALGSGTLLGVVAASVTRALVSAPAPFANTLLAASMASWGFCVFLRNYQLVTYPTLMEDKDRHQNAMPELLLASLRVMTRELKDMIERMEHELRNKQDLLRARAELDALQSVWQVDGDKGASVDARDTAQSDTKRET